MGFSSTSPFGSTPTSPFSSSTSSQGRSVSSSVTQPFFGQGAQPFVSFVQKLTTPQNIPGYNYLTSLLNNPGKVNPYVESQINSAVNQASYNLPIEANKIRGQFYNAPAGRTQLGLDEAVKANNLNLTALKTGLETNQYNQDVQAALAATGQLGNRELGVGSLAAQIAAMLRGSNTTNYGQESSQAQSTPSAFENMMATIRSMGPGPTLGGNGVPGVTPVPTSAPSSGGGGGGSMLDASNQNQALQALVAALGGASGNNSFGSN